MSLSPAQARRWFEPGRRKNASRYALTDAAILANPYRIAECDLGDAKDNAVSLATVDRGVMPDTTIQAAHPVEQDRPGLNSPLTADA